MNSATLETAARTASYAYGSGGSENMPSAAFAGGAVARIAALVIRPRQNCSDSQNLYYSVDDSITLMVTAISYILFYLTLT